MTNKYTHHYQQRVFSRQADTTIEQSLPTSGHVPSAQRTQSGGVARLPRSHTLDAGQSDISRYPAHQALSQTGAWPDRPTHSEKSLPSQIQFGTKAGKRPDTATNIKNTAEPKSRGVHHHPEMTRTAREVLERPSGGVRQDKARLENARRASRQPARDTDVSRAPLTNNGVVRSQSVAGANKKLIQVTLWVDPDVKAHLERKAREEGLSLSPAGAAFLRKAVQQDTDLQYSALLRPIIEDAIAKQMAGLATRLTWLLVRIAFDAGQTRSLVTNILGRQQGVTEPLLKTLLEGSGRSAKANIMRRTPQIASLISSVEQWMLDESRGVKEQKQT